MKEPLAGRCVVCPECLSKMGRVFIAPLGEPCRNCHEIPDPEALNVEDIRAACQEGARGT